MTVQETTAKVEDQVFGAIKASQDAVLSVVDTLAGTAGSITDKLPSPPFADKLPKPAEVVDSYFSFAQKLLANQKDFMLKLADAYRPAKATPAPAQKPTARAA